jgi:hypothetical protein
LEVFQIAAAISAFVVLKHRYKKLNLSRIEQILKRNELSEYVFSFLYNCTIKIQKFFFWIDRRLGIYINKVLQMSAEFLSNGALRLYGESVTRQTNWLLCGVATGIACALVCCMLH